MSNGDRWKGLIFANRQVDIDLAHKAKHSTSSTCGLMALPEGRGGGGGGERGGGERHGEGMGEWKEKREGEGRRSCDQYPYLLPFTSAEHPVGVVPIFSNTMELIEVHPWLTSGSCMGPRIMHLPFWNNYW